MPAPSTTSQLRIVNSLPGAPGVELFFGSPERTLYPFLAYGQVTEYFSVPNDTFLITARFQGTSTIFSIQVTFASAQYTLIIQGTSINPQLVFYTDSKVGEHPQVRAINASAAVPSFDFYLDNIRTPLFRNVTIDSGSVKVKTGAQLAYATQIGTQILLVQPNTYCLRSETNYTFILTGIPNSVATPLRFLVLTAQKNPCH